MKKYYVYFCYYCNKVIYYFQNEAVMKAFRYYDACMNEDEIESLGRKPLIKVITEHGAWSVTNTSWDASSWNFMENFVKIQKHLSVSPLFNMYVGTDLKESTQNIIIVSPYLQSFSVAAPDEEGCNLIDIFYHQVVFLVLVIKHRVWQTCMYVGR